MRKKTKKNKTNIPLKTRKTFPLKQGIKQGIKHSLNQGIKHSLNQGTHYFSTLPLKLDRGGSLSQACPITDETEMMLVPL